MVGEAGQLKTRTEPNSVFQSTNVHIDPSFDRLFPPTQSRPSNFGVMHSCAENYLVWFTVTVLVGPLDDLDPLVSIPLAGIRKRRSSQVIPFRGNTF